MVCGASMAGQVCLAVALRASDLGVMPSRRASIDPVIPRSYGYSDVAESILNPESVCGMIPPTTSTTNKRLVW